MDDKKIEDAAKQHSEESYISDYFQACYKDAFMECAKWVQEEFLKDLWHPVSEEPKKGRVFLYKTIFKGYGLNKIIDGNEWKYIIKYKKATQWLYIDDLLPIIGYINSRPRAIDVYKGKTELRMKEIHQ